MITGQRAETLHGVFGRDGPEIGGTPDAELRQDHCLQHADQQVTHIGVYKWHVSNKWLLQYNI